MKITFLKLAFLFMCFVVVNTVQAQLHISTDERRTYLWDDSDEDWVLLETEDEMTFFTFSEDFTMFEHTTPTIKSAYMIKSTEEDGDLIICDVISDVGNNYRMIIDAENESIRFLGRYNGDYYEYMVRHSIKNVWTDED